MQNFIAILVLIGSFSCSDRQTENSGIQKNGFYEKETELAITAIDATFPLRLDEINLEAQSNIVHLNDGIVSKIQEVINDYAKDFKFHEGFQIYKETHINTISLYDSMQTIFLVLLKHYPTGEVNSRVLFYDNQKEEFLDDVFDFNLWTLYDFDKGKLMPTELKTSFNITSPEIEVGHFNGDGVNDFKFVRLWHNGTFNAIHTTILTIKNNKLDTFHFEEKPIGI